MRLFIGIDCEDLCDAFKGYQNKVLDSIDKDTAKLRPVGSFHITLKFIGEVSEKGVVKIREELREVRFDKFEILLDRIGVFSPKSINVVWIGGEKNAALDRINKDIEEKISKLVPHMKSERDFRPHVTLARAKYVGDKKKFMEKLDNVKVAPMILHVKSFKLYQSVLTSGGPIYSVVEEFTSSTASS